MIYQVQVLAIVVILLSAVDALQMGSMKMSLADYKNELAATAKAIASPGIFLHLYTSLSCLILLYSCRGMVLL